MPTVRLRAPAQVRVGETVTVEVEGAPALRVGRPATLREDRVLPVNGGSVELRLARGWWILSAGEERLRVRVLP